MNLELLCDTLRLTLPELFECGPAPREGVHVSTPMLYPDGGTVAVFVLEREELPVVTDHGAAIGWLRMQSVAERLSERTRSLISEICETQGVAVERGRLVFRCDSAAQVADAVQRVALAAVRVADISITFTSRMRGSVADEVDHWLRERAFKYDRGLRLHGRSNKEWTVDYRVSVDARTSMVFLLSTGSRNATRRIAEHVLAGCVDLSHLRAEQAGLVFVSLFDDTENVWREEDFRLVEGHSKIALWSRPDQFEQILQSQ
jgi:hypothetical protein